MTQLLDAETAERVSSAPCQKSHPWFFAYSFFFLPLSAAAIFSNYTSRYSSWFQCWALCIYVFANAGTLFYASGARSRVPWLWKLIFWGFAAHYVLGGLIDSQRDPVSPEWVLPLWLFVLVFFYPCFCALYELGFDRSLPAALMESLQRLSRSRKSNGVIFRPLYAVLAILIAALIVLPGLSFVLARREASRVILALEKYQSEYHEYPRGTSVLPIGRIQYQKTMGYDSDGRNFYLTQQYAPYAVYDVYYSKDHKWKNGWLRAFDLWTGNIYTAFYERSFSKQQYERALKTAKLGKQYFEKRFGVNSVDAAEASHMAGIAAKVLGRYDEALTYYQEAEKKFSSTCNVDTARCVNFLAHFGGFYMYLGKYEESRKIYEGAWQLTRGHEDEFPAIAADVYNGYGAALAKTGNVQLAKHFFHDALRLYAKNKAPASMRAGTYQGLADLFADQGYTARAASLYLKVIAIWSRRYDDNAGLIASAKTSLGMLYYNTGDLLSAESLLKEAIRLYQRNPVLHRLDLLVAQNFLGTVLYTLGDQRKAQELFVQATQGFQSLFGDSHITLAAPLRSWGTAAMENGRYDEAAAQYRRALGILRTSGSDHSEAVVGTLLDLGQVYEKKGDWAESEKIYRDSLEEAVKYQGKKSSIARYAAEELRRVKKTRKKLKV